MCDTLMDCMDGSDEQNCSSECWPQSACNSDSTCKSGYFGCDNGEYHCADKRDERFCEPDSMSKVQMTSCPGDVNNNSLVEAVMCDGRPECHDLSDECDGSCNVTAPFCNIKSMFNSIHGPFEFLCNDLALYFDAKNICDGKWTNCHPRIDAEELGCPSRHYCRSGDSLSIDINLMCDGVPQCEDKSDEVNCTDRFYCENGEPLSIPILKKMDGRADCSDTSDECPKELDKNVFSSRKELIGSAVFRATTWIFGLAAIVGNTGTFVYAAKTLSRFSSLNPITKLNYILLINLSVADGLMGVYLIALGSKGIEYSGNYCRFDKYWRTSSTCSNLGSLALVSSEATVLILAFLATLRLFSILNPLKTKRISIKIPIASIIVAWLLAIFVGVAPQFSSLSDQFSSAVWMPTKLTTFDIQDRGLMFTFVQRLFVAQPTAEQPPTSPSW
uniref:G-protein coupled receptors family 1 profile domain-containing protein n=1 Tax=Ciona savignyi TaxID=51511 RepID=H2ZG92_CIOSA